jgi:hypothetical protein
MRETKAPINSSRVGKAAGADGLTNEAFKHTQTCLPVCVWLFNTIFCSAMLVAICREAIIAPIFKSGDSQDPANYRFISLLCAPAKIFASINLKRIENYIDSAKLLRPEQIGFRAGYSTVRHALILHTLVQQALNNNAALHVAFVDFK